MEIQLLSNYEGHLNLCFHSMDSTISLLSKSKILNLNLKQSLTIFCGCTAQFVSDLVRNHNIGFDVLRLIYIYIYIYMANGRQLMSILKEPTTSLNNLVRLGLLRWYNIKLTLGIMSIQVHPHVLHM